MISSSLEVSSTAQLAKVRTETLYGVKRRMNLRLCYARLWITANPGEKAGIFYSPRSLGYNFVILTPSEN